MNELATYPLEPRWYFVFSVSANVGLDDDNGEKRGERYENHVHTEICP
jgi:hypothetical protein